jgi:tRNA threonylcarbamoyladenosine biosynthesis protein TsaE
MEWQFELSKIKEIATMFWKNSGDASVFAFHGPMGSGKTTFIHALCDVKHVKDIVGSPTFSIINEYAYKVNGLDKKLFHIDLYRLKDEREVIHAGVEDCFYSGHICLVEWPDKALNLLPPGTVHIYIKVIDAQTRSITINDK